jgi:cytochrome c556
MSDAVDKPVARTWQHWMACVAAGALLVAVGLGSVALSQDQSIATPKDVIFARKILMDSIGHNMDELEANAASAKVDLTEGKDHADIVSVMLMAFPHLFPPSSNQWKPNVERDPGVDTFAAPEVWTSYADFYKRAAAASKIAYNASRAEKEADFKAAIAELRVACDSCHGVYYKTP